MPANSLPHLPSKHRGLSCDVLAHPLHSHREREATITRCYQPDVCRTRIQFPPSLHEGCRICSNAQLDEDEDSSSPHSSGSPRRTHDSLTSTPPCCVAPSLLPAVPTSCPPHSRRICADAHDSTDFTGCAMVSGQPDELSATTCALSMSPVRPCTAAPACVRYSCIHGSDAHAYCHHSRELTSQLVAAAEAAAVCGCWSVFYLDLQHRVRGIARVPPPRTALPLSDMALVWKMEADLSRGVALGRICNDGSSAVPCGRTRSEAKEKEGRVSLPCLGKRKDDDSGDGSMADKRRGSIHTKSNNNNNKFLCFVSGRPTCCAADVKESAEFFTAQPNCARNTSLSVPAVSAPPSALFITSAEQSKANSLCVCHAQRRPAPVLPACAHTHTHMAQTCHEAAAHEPRRAHASASSVMVSPLRASSAHSVAGAVVHSATERTVPFSASVPASAAVVAPDYYSVMHALYRHATAMKMKLHHVMYYHDELGDYVLLTRRFTGSCRRGQFLVYVCEQDDDDSDGARQEGEWSDAKRHAPLAVMPTSWTTDQKGSTTSKQSLSCATCIPPVLHAHHINDKDMNTNNNNISNGNTNYHVYSASSTMDHNEALANSLFHSPGAAATAGLPSADFSLLPRPVADTYHVGNVCIPLCPLTDTHPVCTSSAPRPHTSMSRQGGRAALTSPTGGADTHTPQNDKEVYSAHICSSTSSNTWARAPVTAVPDVPSATPPLTQTSPVCHRTALGTRTAHSADHCMQRDTHTQDNTRNHLFPQTSHTTTMLHNNDTPPSTHTPHSAEEDVFRAAQRHSCSPHDSNHSPSPIVFFTRPELRRHVGRQRRVLAAHLDALAASESRHRVRLTAHEADARASRTAQSSGERVAAAAATRHREEWERWLQARLDAQQRVTHHEGASRHHTQLHESQGWQTLMKAAAAAAARAQSLLHEQRQLAQTEARVRLTTLHCEEARRWLMAQAWWSALQLRMRYHRSARDTLLRAECVARGVLAQTEWVGRVCGVLRVMQATVRAELMREEREARELLRVRRDTVSASMRALAQRWALVEQRRQRESAMRATSERIWALRRLEKKRNTKEPTEAGEASASKESKQALVRPTSTSALLLPSASCSLLNADVVPQTSAPDTGGWVWTAVMITLGLDGVYESSGREDSHRVVRMTLGEEAEQEEDANKTDAVAINAADVEVAYAVDEQEVVEGACGGETGRAKLGETHTVAEAQTQTRAQTVHRPETACQGDCSISDLVSSVTTRSQLAHSEPTSAEQQHGSLSPVAPRRTTTTTTTTTGMQDPPASLLREAIANDVRLCLGSLARQVRVLTAVSAVLPRSSHTATDNNSYNSSRREPKHAPHTAEVAVSHDTESAAPTRPYTACTDAMHSSSTIWFTDDDAEPEGGLPGVNHSMVIQLHVEHDGCYRDTQLQRMIASFDFPCLLQLYHRYAAEDRDGEGGGEEEKCDDSSWAIADDPAAVGSARESGSVVSLRRPTSSGVCRSDASCNNDGNDEDDEKKDQERVEGLWGNAEGTGAAHACGVPEMHSSMLAQPCVRGNRIAARESDAIAPPPRAHFSVDDLLSTSERTSVVDGAEERDMPVAAPELAGANLRDTRTRSSNSSSSSRRAQAGCDGSLWRPALDTQCRADSMRRISSPRNESRRISPYTGICYANGDEDDDSGTRIDEAPTSSPSGVFTDLTTNDRTCAARTLAQRYVTLQTCRCNNDQQDEEKEEANDGRHDCQRGDDVGRAVLTHHSARVCGTEWGVVTGAAPRFLRDQFVFEVSELLQCPAWFVRNVTLRATDEALVVEFDLLQMCFWANARTGQPARRSSRSTEGMHADHGRERWRRDSDDVPSYRAMRVCPVVGDSFVTEDVAGRGQSAALSPTQLQTRVDTALQQHLYSLLLELYRSRFELAEVALENGGMTEINELALLACEVKSPTREAKMW